MDFLLSTIWTSESEKFKRTRTFCLYSVLTIYVHASIALKLLKFKTQMPRLTVLVSLKSHSFYDTNHERYTKLHSSKYIFLTISQTLCLLKKKITITEPVVTGYKKLDIALNLGEKKNRTWGALKCIKLSWWNNDNVSSLERNGILKYNFKQYIFF